MANESRQCAVPDCTTRPDASWGICRTHIRELQRTAPVRPRVRRERETMEWLGMLQRMLRSAGARVADADEFELRGLLGLQADLDRAIQVAVDGQRARRGWAHIGYAAGTSRQAAFKRWGKPAETGDRNDG